MRYVAAILAAYLIGAIPVGWIVGRLCKGIDIREHGSGNIGATNVWRTIGPGAALMVFLLDVGKGVAGVIVSRCIGGAVAPGAELAGAVGVVSGHNWSVFLGFKGGRGVATSLGVGLSLIPGVALIAFAVWGVTLAVTRYVSVASIASAVTVIITPWFLLSSLPLQILSVVVGVFIVVRHRANIERLRQGTEPKVGHRHSAESEDAAEGKAS